MTMKVTAHDMMRHDLQHNHQCIMKKLFKYLLNYVFNGQATPLDNLHGFQIRKIQN